MLLLRSASLCSIAGAAVHALYAAALRPSWLLHDMMWLLLWLQLLLLGWRSAGGYVQWRPVNSTARDDARGCRHDGDFRGRKQAWWQPRLLSAGVFASDGQTLTGNRASTLPGRCLLHAKTGVTVFALKHLI